MPLYARLTSIAALLFSLILLADLIASPRHSWVQADYMIHLPLSTWNGLSIEPIGDVLNAVRTQASLDQRARFTGYVLIALDQKLRLAVLERGVVLPAFNPVLWTLHGVLGPLLLFLFMRRATGLFPALAAVAAYLSSPGFLYVFTMNWLPQKAIVSLVLLVLLYLTVRVHGRLPEGALFAESEPRQTALLLGGILLVGYLTDEYGFLVPLLMATLFWHRFRPVPLVFSRVTNPWNAWLFVAPILAFLVIMIIIVPIGCRLGFGFGFDYIGRLLAAPVNVAGAKTNAWGLFLAPVENFVNMLSISLMPYELASPDPRFPPHFGVQSLGPLNLFFLAIWLGTTGATLFVQKNKTMLGLRHALVALAVATLFISILAFRHEPRIINGFYYGSPLAVLWAITMGFLAHEARGVVRAVAMVLLAWCVGVQAINLHYLNEVWSRGSDAYMEQSYGDIVPLRRTEPERVMEELAAVTAAYRDKKLDAYLTTTRLPSRLMYLLAEICVKEPTASRVCPLLTARLKSLTGSH